MEMDSIITSLDDIKSHCTSEADRNVCAAAISIIYALQDGGACTVEEAKDIICDYNKLAKQYQAMYKQFGIADRTIHKDGVWHCPSCNRRVNPGHSFCHSCGKKLNWR